MTGGCSAKDCKAQENIVEDGEVKEGRVKEGEVEGMRAGVFGRDGSVNIIKIGSVGI